jgi:hypothetical protein
VLVNLLNKWVKALDLEALKTIQKKILSQLCLDNRTYL